MNSYEVYKALTDMIYEARDILDSINHISKRKYIDGEYKYKYDGEMFKTLRNLIELANKEQENCYL